MTTAATAGGGTTAEGTTAGTTTETSAAAAAAAATATAESQAQAGAGTTTGTEGKTPEQIAAEKADADKAAADKAAADAAAAAAKQGAPEKYELTVPEGGHLDQSDVDAFVEKARAKGLTNEQAQAVLTEQATELAAQSQRFLEETQAHPEIGGAHLEQAQLHANKALDRLLPATSPEGQAFRSLLTKTGYGNHHTVLLLLSRAGKAMAEDRPLNLSDRRGAGQRSAADVLFGDAKK